MVVAVDRMQSLRVAALGAVDEQLASCYQSFDAPLRAFLARETRSIQDAEDLAQEVFLRVWRMGGRGEIRHLKAFVFKTATNLLKDRSRRTYTRMMSRAVPAADLDLPDCAGEPCGMVESLQTLTLFSETIAHLRPSTRTAFLLYQLEARTHAQIAAEMGISVSMVEKHVSYAMAALRGAGVVARDS